MHDDDERRHAPRVCDWSMALGVASLVCALVPVIGDWLSAPLAVAALGLGSWGIHVADRDLRPGVARGLIGAMLGLVALGVVGFSIAAGMGHPAG